MGKRSRKNIHKPPLNVNGFIERFCGVNCWSGSCKHPSFCYDFFFVRSPYQFEYKCHEEIRALRMFNAVMAKRSYTPSDEFMRIFCSVCTFNEQKRGTLCKRLPRCMHLFNEQIRPKDAHTDPEPSTRTTKKVKPPLTPYRFARGSSEWMARFME